MAIAVYLELGLGNFGRKKFKIKTSYDVMMILNFLKNYQEKDKIKIWRHDDL